MRPYFEERQRFTQWWLWLIVGATALAVTTGFVYGIISQIVLKRPWGTQPMTDEVLIVVSLVTISCTIGALLVFFNAVLEITVEHDSISYRYFPLIRSWRRIEKETIGDFSIRKYYLKGYGVKRDWDGLRIINVKGNMGIEITFHDGKKLLLGTQQPDELFQALKRMKQSRY